MSEEQPDLNMTLAETDVSIENLKITNTQDFEKNDHVMEAGQKAPLSWFINSNSSDYQPESLTTTDLHTSTFITNIGSPVSASGRQVAGKEPTTKNNQSNSRGASPDSINPSPKPELDFIDFDNKPYPEFYPIEGNVINQDLTRRNIIKNKDSTKKIYPLDPIEEELRIEGGRAWQFYGAAQTHILNQIAKEKDQKRHQLFLIDTKTKRLEQMQHDLTIRESNLTIRETRVFEAEPFLGVAKELQNLGIDMGLALPWIEVIRRKAEVENVDIRACATKLSQELTQYGSLQKQIENANQELVLINMAMIQKQKVVKVIEGLLNRGITESQIINFSWQVQQPNNQVDNGGSAPGNEISMQDWIKLNLLSANTTRQLGRLNH